jgi:class 3 adenylate cyclase
MAQESGYRRRLAAVMFTDMVGYSTLANRNEREALKLLDEHNALLRPLFATHAGVEVNTTGDGFHVEFTSALDAVRCAIDIQKTLHERNRASTDGRAATSRLRAVHSTVVHKSRSDRIFSFTDECALQSEH